MGQMQRINVKNNLAILRNRSCYCRLLVGPVLLQSDRNTYQPETQKPWPRGSCHDAAPRCVVARELTNLPSSSINSKKTSRFVVSRWFFAFSLMSQQGFNLISCPFHCAHSHSLCVRRVTRTWRTVTGRRSWVSTRRTCAATIPRARWALTSTGSSPSTRTDVPAHRAFGAKSPTPHTE